jgi:hypothetical protein
LGSVEAARTHPVAERPPDSEALWQEVAPYVQQGMGLLVIDDSTLDKPHARHSYAERAWRIEEYHRSLKQFTGVECAQFRRARLQRNHIGLALSAFMRLELHRVHHWISHAEAKTAIIRHALRWYLAQPTIALPSTA